MSMKRWMDKEAEVHTHNGTLLSHKRESIWVSPNVSLSWTNLELTVESEVSQKEKNKYCILTQCRELERWYQWAYLQDSNGDADIENSLVGPAREGGGKTNRENSTETLSIKCKRASRREPAAWGRELNPGLCDPREGWVGEEVGGCPLERGNMCYLWLSHVDAWQKAAQYGKPVTLQ